MDELINEKIHVKFARAISKDGKNLGILDLEEIAKIAYGDDLDMVLVTPAAPGQTAVIKIMDYHQEQFKKKKARKKPEEIDKKEIQFSSETAEHDLKTSANKCDKWFSNGKVIVTVRVKMFGRMVSRPEIAVQKCCEFLNLLTEKFKIVNKPENTGRDIIATIQNY